MLTVSLESAPSRSVLAIGCHADDIEIGCGGTLVHLVQALPAVDVTWVVLGARGVRAGEAQRSAEAFLAGVADPRIIVRDFRDGFFPHDAVPIKEFFEELKAQLSPDMIFTHYRGDLHQDHRLACELTWNTWRDHFILEYEIPKYDGDFGTPNVFFPLSESVVEKKVENLLSHFASQRDRHWFTADLFRATARLRGMESNSATRYAEAFYGRKVICAA